MHHASRSRFVLTPSALAQRSKAGCAIMIMYKVSTSARRSNSDVFLDHTRQLSAGLRTRVIAGRHKVDQTLIDNTVTVKERHVPLQS